MHLYGGETRRTHDILRRELGKGKLLRSRKKEPPEFQARLVVEKRQVRGPERGGEWQKVRRGGGGFNMIRKRKRKFRAEGKEARSIHNTRKTSTGQGKGPVYGKGPCSRVRGERGPPERKKISPLPEEEQEQRIRRQMENLTRKGEGRGSG